MVGWLSLTTECTQKLRALLRYTFCSSVLLLLNWVVLKATVCENAMGRGKMNVYTRTALAPPPSSQRLANYVGNIFQENILLGPIQLNTITVVHISHVMLTFLLVLTFPEHHLCFVSKRFYGKRWTWFFMVFKYTEPWNTCYM